RSDLIEWSSFSNLFKSTVYVTYGLCCRYYPFAIELKNILEDTMSGRMGRTKIERRSLFSDRAFRQRNVVIRHESLYFLLEIIFQTFHHPYQPWSVLPGGIVCASGNNPFHQH